MTTIHDLLKQAIQKSSVTPTEFGRRAGIRKQYMNDLLSGRRGLGPAMVNRVCDIIQATDAQRKKWHQAGARHHGWEI